MRFDVATLCVVLLATLAAAAPLPVRPPPPFVFFPPPRSLPLLPLQPPDEEAKPHEVCDGQIVLLVILTCGCCSPRIGTAVPSVVAGSAIPPRRWIEEPCSILINAPFPALFSLYVSLLSMASSFVTLRGTWLAGLGLSDAREYPSSGHINNRNHLANHALVSLPAPSLCILIVVRRNVFSLCFFVPPGCCVFFFSQRIRCSLLYTHLIVCMHPTSKAFQHKQRTGIQSSRSSPPHRLGTLPRLATIRVRGQDAIETRARCHTGGAIVCPMSSMSSMERIYRQKLLQVETRASVVIRVMGFSGVGDVDALDVRVTFGECKVQHT